MKRADEAIVRDAPITKAIPRNTIVGGASLAALVREPPARPIPTSDRSGELFWLFIGRSGLDRVSIHADERSREIVIVFA